MLIDWFTVGAQLLNFLILVWLMKRFLYQPVLDAIAAREHKIAAELADAATAKAEAQQQQDEFQQKNQDFDEQRAELLRQAQDAAKAERSRLQTEARQAAEAASAALAKALQNDARQLRDDLSRRAQAQVFDISRRVLADLASVSLEQRACEVFIGRLRAVEGAARSTLVAALRAASQADPALLRSAFAMLPAQRAAIQAVLDEVCGQPVPLSFETDAELVGGIEVSAQGQKLAWSISGYLAALASGLQERPGTMEPA